MADNTKIEWADATVNAVNGCSLASPGCTNCYAMKQAHRFPSRAGLTQESKAGPVWTGEVRLNETALLDPLKWKRPRRIFWNAHGDTFHDAVPDAWIDRVFAVCALTPQHTHMILTKRSARMRQYMEKTIGRIADRAIKMRRDRGDSCVVVPLPHIRPGAAWWPLPNVWLGVSVEDQTRADERIPDLLATPAAVRFISAEPLLGPVDISPWIPTCYECGASCGLRLPVIPEVERCTECGEECGPDSEPVFSDGCPKCSGELEPVCPDCGHYMVYQHPDTPNIDWVIVGGENGPRPMHRDWVRALRDQCAAAAVAFHFKQWGTFWPTEAVPNDSGGVDFVPPIPIDANIMRLRKWVGNETRAARPDESVGEFFEPGHFAVPLGKKAAGRLLDGIEHNGVPA